jgi:hypothetical protein
LRTGDRRVVATQHIQQPASYLTVGAHIPLYPAWLRTGRKPA